MGNIYDCIEISPLVKYLEITSVENPGNINKLNRIICGI